MPHGVVLLPSWDLHERLTALAAEAGGPGAFHRLGATAPAHVSVAHFDGGWETVAARFAESPVRELTVKIIGLLYAVVPPGDYYTPQGGVYLGVEVVRRPDLDTLHTEVLGWLREAGATPLGNVGPDYRPHVTLGVTTTPALPALSAVPVGEFPVRLAFGELGPYGTFPGLAF